MGRLRYQARRENGSQTSQWPHTGNRGTDKGACREARPARGGERSAAVTRQRRVGVACPISPGCGPVAFGGWPWRTCPTTGSTAEKHLAVINVINKGCQQPDQSKRCEHHSEWWLHNGILVVLLTA